MAAQFYVVVIVDPSIADRRWPSSAPHEVGQARSFASQEPGQEDSLEVGITPPEIMMLNGVEAIELDHEPDFSVERWDAASKSLIPYAERPALAELEAQRVALDRQITDLKA